jgi:hypothetical protein
MAFDLARIEHVHVDVDVDLVVGATQSVQLREHGRRCAAEIIHAHLLNGRGIEELLLERVGEPHATHDDLGVRERRIELGIEAHPMQRTSGGDGDGHAA